MKVSTVAEPNKFRVLRVEEDQFRSNLWPVATSDFSDYSSAAQLAGQLNISADGGKGRHRIYDDRGDIVFPPEHPSCVPLRQ